MSEASSHATSNQRLLEAIEAFETPQAVALSCLGKNAAQIVAMLCATGDVVAEQRGFTKGGAFADQRALRYAAEAIEWLWKQTERVDV